MKILVTGGTGFLGRHLATALLKAGHQVHLLGRNFSQAGALIDAGARMVVCDLRERATVVQACQGMDAVYHVGALSSPWGRRADFLATNVGGTEAVLEGCRKHGVERCIYVSSPSVVFNGKDQHLLTDAAPYPRHFVSIYSHTKKIGEDLVNAAAQETGLCTVILRPKAIFGPGDQTLLPRLIDAARLGRLPQIGNGENLVDLTYVENVVHALLLALDAQAATGKTYTITNDEHIPLWGIIQTVLKRLGLPTTLRKVPLAAALTAASVMELGAALNGREPLLTRYSVLILARTQTYDISAARRELDYRPVISIAEGLERTLETLKEHL